MVKNINDVEDFASKIERNCDPDFLVELAGEWLKIIANNFETKDKIINFL